MRAELMPKEHASGSAFVESDVTGVTAVTPSAGAGCGVTAGTQGGVTAVTFPGHQHDEEVNNPATSSTIPGVEDRPKYIVIERLTEVDGRSFEPGVWYCGLEGKKGETPEPVERWICSPLRIRAITHDVHGGEYGRLLRFKPTCGDWREWAMPQELLAGGGEEIRRELLRQGVVIDQKHRSHLAQYLQSGPPKKRIECATQTGWSRDSFVLPDTVIGPSAASITFQSVEAGSNEYAVGGTLQGWQESVAALAKGNPVILLALSAAFAGPLLKRCHAESGGVHFIGDSSTGKTSALIAGCSVWGGGSYRRSWCTTANGLEGAASLFNDSLLALDEISQADPREVGACVYALGNGVGKQRASRSGATRPVKRWLCSVLSTGERSVESSMREGGHKAKAGQAVRLLDIPVARTHGAWDELHGMSGADFSDALKTASAHHFGHAGRAFLERLAFDDRDFAPLLEDLSDTPDFHVSDGQRKRASRRMALFGLAGELATEYGITGWPAGAATEAAATLFRTWCDQRGQGPSEQRQVIESVRDFIDRHGCSRFSDFRGEKVAVHNRAGWWREDANGHRVYLFNTGAMQEAIGGHDKSRAYQHLLDAGALVDCGANEKAKATRTPEGARKLYTIDRDRLEVHEDGA